MTRRPGCTWPTGCISRRSRSRRHPKRSPGPGTCCSGRCSGTSAGAAPPTRPTSSPSWSPRSSGRRLGGAPVPFFPVTATDQASGKTLLAAICGALFGQAKIIWTDDEEELRKQLTTVMRSQEGVITFDNLPEGTVIRSGVLAKLLTDRTWGDRLLGGNVLAKFANDRLWCATGNNIRLGGDMRSRSVLVGLDARMPHPERRTGFMHRATWSPGSRNRVTSGTC